MQQHFSSQQSLGPQQSCKQFQQPYKLPKHEAPKHNSHGRHGSHEPLWVFWILESSSSVITEAIDFLLYFLVNVNIIGIVFFFLLFRFVSEYTLLNTFFVHLFIWEYNFLLFLKNASNTLILSYIVLKSIFYCDIWLQKRYIIMAKYCCWFYYITTI